MSAAVPSAHSPLAIPWAATCTVMIPSQDGVPTHAWLQKEHSSGLDQCCWAPVSCPASVFHVQTAAQLFSTGPAMLQYPQSPPQHSSGVQNKFPILFCSVCPCSHPFRKAGKNLPVSDNSHPRDSPADAERGFFHFTLLC